MEKVVVLDPSQFYYLMFVFAGTLVIVWGIFWFVVSRGKTDPLAIVSDSGFLRIVTVGFTLYAVLILALAGIFSGELAAAIISGVIGYVLGSNRPSRTKARRLDKSERNKQKELPDKSSETRKLPPD